MKKFKLKSMGPKQILAYVVFLIAVVWTLKFIFELTSSGVKQVTSSSSGKICYYPGTYFDGEIFTGKYAKKNIYTPDQYETKYGPASSYCVEGNALAIVRCETTSDYKKFDKKYDKCIASGGKDTLEFSMKSCSRRSVDVASEIRGEWYKDCMKEKGW